MITETRIEDPTTWREEPAEPPVLPPRRRPARTRLAREPREIGGILLILAISLALILWVSWTRGIRMGVPVKYPDPAGTSAGPVAPAAADPAPGARP
jgi:hypothetical protein